MDDDFDRLFREHFAPLVRYLARQLGDRDAAEEVAQEVFLRALRNPPRLNERAWLYTVATNLLRDGARRDARYQRNLELLYEEHLASLRAGSAIDAAPADAHEPPGPDAPLVRRALYALNDRDRSALLMSEEGLTYHEIAAALGLTVPSVGTTLTRARHRLMQHYQTLVRETQSGGANATS